jgi:hypothetical protein
MENKQSKRNPNWDFEEMVALVDIYMRHRDGTNTQALDEDLQELSIALNKRADMLGIQKGDKFRNFNGMKMTYKSVDNAFTNDTNSFGSGSKLRYEVLEFYQKHRREFDIILKHFKDNYSSYLVCITFLSGVLMNRLY